MASRKLAARIRSSPVKRNATQHQALWDSSGIHDLGGLGGTYGTATDINNLGMVVGVSFLPGDQNEHATLWDGYTLSDLGTLGGASVATSINDKNQIVGLSY